MRVEEGLGSDDEDGGDGKKRTTKKGDNLRLVLEEEEDFDLPREDGTKEAVLKPSFDSVAAAEGISTQTLSSEAALPSISTVT